MQTNEVIEGLLQPDGTLRLDGRPALPAGRVRVTLEAVGEPEDAWLVLDRIRDRRHARGARRRTRREIDDAIRLMREEWASPPEPPETPSDAATP